MLRKVFDNIYTPSTLSSKLKTLEEHLRDSQTNLSEPQLEQLFPQSGVKISSEKWDIILLCKLLEEICKLTPYPPSTGWEILPNASDKSLGADIARIKVYRDTIYSYVMERKLDDESFNELWKDISSALIRINEIQGCFQRRFISEWKTSDLVESDQENISKLQAWYMYDHKVKPGRFKCTIQYTTIHYTTVQYNTIQYNMYRK